MLKKGDMLLVGIIALVILGAYFGFRYQNSAGDNTNKTAVIIQDKKELQRIELDSVKEPYKVEINGDYREIIMVEKGRIRFLEAECPDKVCVRTGWLSSKGESAVCIPNRTIIKIEGASDKVDGVAY